MNLAGQVSDKNGELLDDFSGEVVLTIFDKELEKTTLGNDGNGKFTFNSLGNVVFKGNAEVNNGFWNLELVIPKDISLPLGQARISMYAISNDKTAKKQAYLPTFLLEVSIKIQKLITKVHKLNFFWMMNHLKAEI